jgi:hypothetical protein
MLTIRDAFTRHNTTYFVIDDVYAPFEGDDVEIPKDSKELSAKLARDIGEVFNLTFVRHETITKPFSNPFFERITYAFRCSQCEELAKNRPHVTTSRNDESAKQNQDSPVMDPCASRSRRQSHGRRKTSTQACDHQKMLGTEWRQVQSKSETEEVRGGETSRRCNEDPASQ